MTIAPTHPVCPGCQAVLRAPGVRAFSPVRCAGCGTNVLLRADIDRFRLLYVVRRTGLGAVYRALDRKQGRRMDLELIQLPAGLSARDAHRLTVTARLIAGLAHPHCVKIEAAGIEAGVAYIVPESLPEDTLRTRLRGGFQFGLLEMLEIGVAAASGLSAAFKAGLTHRHLSLGLVHFDEHGTVKIGGFLETLVYELAAAAIGMFYGHVCYFPPERLLYEPEDLRGDIYALGAVLLKCVGVSVADEGELCGDRLMERIIQQPMRIEESIPEVPRLVAGVLNRMVHPSPAFRFSTWGEVIERLTQARDSMGKAEANGRHSAPTDAVEPGFSGNLLSEESLSH